VYRGCFLDTAGGRVHLATFGSLASRHVWLYLPPFAEEMNLSRAVVARQARAFEARQEAVVCLDYFGTGDSAGTFQQAELAFWLENVRGALEWIEQQGAASVSLWGLRFGGLLAVHYLLKRPSSNCLSVLLWKPVLNAKQMLGQFFRLKQVSTALQGDEKVNWMARMKAGETVEVAGYCVTPSLLEALDNLSMPTELPDSFCRLEWIDITAGAMSPALVRVTQKWPSERLQLQTCNERLFWQSPDCYVAPSLLEQTLNQTRTVADDCRIAAYP
jgi:exosortase A-associated hydrolase 2